MAAACSAETQPLNTVPGDSTGGSGGSSATGGSGGNATGGSGGSSATGGSGGNATGGSGGSSATGGSGGSSATGGSGGNATGGSGGSSATGGSGGSSATGGSGGVGGSEARDVHADKLDILFVVDNSIGMADKQKFLALAAGELLDRLADPRCVDGDDPALAEGCAPGQQREFAPVVDMHVGVISTSLGSHGGETCSNTGNGASSWNPTKNDAGKLMPSVREDQDLPGYQDQGFLAWDALEVDGEAEHDLEALKGGIREHIQSLGEMGCGYEAPLEAMYRFLIDPSPPKEIVVVDNIAQPTTDDEGNEIVDTEVLEQRANFLRPDSALAVILLSDEDDCSVVDEGLGWLTATTSKLPNATIECEADPNDPCCRSCGIVAPSGCTDSADDPNCAAAQRDPAEDPPNLRCFDQKRRFGLDLLYPVERYVSGLTDLEIHDGDDLVRNPLFPPEQPEVNFTRRASEVFVASLVGVPWQDLATEGSLTGAGLTYKSTFDSDDWSLIVGNPSSYVAPGDPLMVASVDPRTGTHPITGEPLGPVDSTNPLENSINGHEFAAEQELQYACTFPLAEYTRDCSTVEETYFCECGEGDLSQNKPLCQPPGGGEATTMQYSAAARPGLRQLELMSKLPRAVPASICPKVVDGDIDDSNYGYNPAMRALVSELKSVLK